MLVVLVPDVTLCMFKFDGFVRVGELLTIVVFVPCVSSSLYYPNAFDIKTIHTEAHLQTAVGQTSAYRAMNADAFIVTESRSYEICLSTRLLPLSDHLGGSG
eukprot:6483264-Amphidinium_carterae.1